MTEWISVDDDRPQEDVEVLIVYCHYKGRITVTTASLELINGFRHWWHGDEMIGTTAITHWMKLPAPPTKNKISEEDR